MGNFVTQIHDLQKKQKQKAQAKNQLLDLDLAKLKQYYSQFCQICDTFSIDAIEFDQIFSKTEDLFLIWDTDENGIIDSLELFSGLIIFSESSFEEKVQFLFTLFDFNNILHIKLIDLEFMLICCCNSAYKVFDERKIEIKEELISMFLNEYFTEESIIDYKSLLNWCYKVEMVELFFIGISKEVPKRKRLYQRLNLQNIETNLQVGHWCEGYKKMAQEKERVDLSRYRQPVCESIERNRQQTIDYLGTLMEKVFQRGVNDSDLVDVSVKTHWVHGYRHIDVRHSMVHLKAKVNQKATERILYFTSNIVIIYFPKLNEQKHYLLHEHEVISLTAGNCTSLVASGEKAASPAIHIWNSNTLVDIGIIRGHHQQAVHLVEFFSQDTLLASSSVRAHSPILVHSLQDLTLLFSTYVPSLTLDLFSIQTNANIHQQFTLDLDNTFIVLTSHTIYQYSYSDGHFQIKSTAIHKHSIHKAIREGLAFQKGNSYSLVTSHNNTLVVWNQLESYKVVLEGVSVNSISLYESIYVVVSTGVSTLSIFDVDMKALMTFDLSDQTTKVISTQIHEVIPADNTLIVTSIEGDVIDIQIDIFNKKHSSNRNNNITQLQGNLFALNVLQVTNDQRLVSVAGDNNRIYTMSLETKELVDIFQIGEIVTSLDSTMVQGDKRVQAIGCSRGVVYLRKDFENDFDQIEVEGAVIKVKFSLEGDLLVILCSSGRAYIYEQDGENYHTTTGMKVHFDNEVPLQVQFTDEGHFFLIETSNKAVYKFNRKDMEYKNLAHDVQQVNVSVWNLAILVDPNALDQDMSSFSPDYKCNHAIIGGQANLLLFTDSNGFLYFYKNKTQLLKNCGGKLHAHMSDISGTVLTYLQDLLISSGKSDQTVIEWKVQFVDDQNEFKVINEDIEHQKVEFSNTQLNNECAMLYKECQSFSTIQRLQKDNFVEFKQCQQQLISEIHNVMHIKQSGEKSEKGEKKNMNQSVNELYRNRRPPPVSVQLEQVLGFKCQDQRKTLHYIHSYSLERKAYSTYQQLQTTQPAKKTQSNLNVSVNIPYEMQNEMLFTKQALLPYDQSHHGCQRYFMYFTSRIVVIYDPATRQQINFYEGHKHKISCICVHPQKSLIISGEQCNEPQLHVWNSLNMEALRVLKTFHTNGVLKLGVSKCGTYVGSVGMDTNYSVQVTNWITDEVVAFIHTSPLPIFDIMFNPYDKNQLVTAGYANLTVWSIDCRNLVRKQIVQLDKSNILTCVQFISYNLGNVIQSDLICGNNSGDLSIVAHGKYIRVKEKAHKGMLNVLRITELLDDKVIIITAAEDEYVRIWDTKFQLINDINLREQFNFGQLDRNVNLSAQSLDLFSCPAQFKSNSQFGAYLLIGLRNGSIMESGLVIVSRGGVKEESSVGERVLDDEQDDDVVFTSKKSKANEQSQSVSFQLEHNLHLQFHASPHPSHNNRKVHMAVDGPQDILLTIGEDNILHVWSLKNNSHLLFQQLQYTPTAIKAVPMYAQFVLGYANGTLQILQLTCNNNNKYKLDVIKEEIQEGLNYILNIQVANLQQKIAVSYDSTSSTQVKNSSSPQPQQGVSHTGVPFIKVWERINDKFVKNETNTITLKVSDNISDTQQMRQGVYFMFFSSDDQFLIFCQQNIDNFYIRQNQQLNEQMKFLIYNLSYFHSVKFSDDYQEIKFETIDFANCIQGLYQLYENLEPKQVYENNNLRLSQMLVVKNAQLNEKYIVYGSMMGDLHMVRYESLLDEKPNDLQNLKQYFIGKTYTAHNSFVNQIIQYTPNTQDPAHSYLFTTGVTDESVLKWRLTIENNELDKDYEKYDVKESDKYQEVKSLEKFTNDLAVFLPLRKEIKNVKQQIDDREEPEQEIELQNCIGRKAFNSRNNLFYDFDERIIYIAGCNLIISDFNYQQYQQEKEGEQEESGLFGEYVKQEFIDLDWHDPESISPEVQTICMSEDKKYLAAGTNQIYSRVVVWDICSLTCIHVVQLKDCVSVTHIRFSFNKKSLLVLAITKDYQQILFLLDLPNNQVLAQALFKYSSVHRYKDIQFFPYSTTKFALVGHNVVQVWHFKGDNFSYYNLAHNLQDKQQVVFMSVIFIKNIIITGGDDGLLYQWDQFKFLKIQQAHPKHSILCLNVNQNGTQFASGGTDGRVILWDISSKNNLILEKIHEYSVLEQDQEDQSVQSLCIGKVHILCGTKQGHIYELEIPRENDTNKTNQTRTKLRMRADDEETVINISFSANSDQLLTITEKGHFCVWDIATLSRNFSRHYHKDTVNMIVCTKTPKIFIAFKNEIIVLRNEIDYPILANQSYINNDIDLTQIKLSSDERKLALALGAELSQCPKLFIFDLELDESNLFKLVQKQDNLSNRIEYMDISTDNFYLMFRDNMEEVVYFSLDNLQKENQITNEYDVEWAGDGIKFSEKTKGIESFYPHENKSNKITKLNQNTMVVTDDMGTIRIFRYPYESQNVGFMRVYTNHMSYISQCTISHDYNYLVTYSKTDKCMLIWQNKKNKKSKMFQHLHKAFENIENFIENEDKNNHDNQIIGSDSQEDQDQSEIIINNNDQAQNKSQSNNESNDNNES